ncbi:MAG: hypothetical protein WC009_10435, partial [Methylotenera sp.]
MHRSRCLLNVRRQKASDAYIRVLDRLPRTRTAASSHGSVVTGRSRPDIGMGDGRSQSDARRVPDVRQQDHRREGELSR